MKKIKNNQLRIFYSCIIILLYFSSCHQLDHFKVYEVDRVEMNKNCTLMGQFDKVTDTVQLKYLGAFANPVDKNNEGIEDLDAHLNWYYFEQKEPKREVVFENQFGDSTKWIIGDSRWLLVPTHKMMNEHRKPKDLDHFKCYICEKGEPFIPGKYITLTDQFDLIWQKKEFIKKLIPAFFCVPVMKNNERMFYPKDHLTIYNIIPEDTIIKDFKIRVEDQFIRDTLKINKAIRLGVPTKKLSWKVIK